MSLCDGQPEGENYVCYLINKVMSTVCSRKQFQEQLDVHLVYSTSVDTQDTLFHYSELSYISDNHEYFVMSEVQ